MQQNKGWNGERGALGCFALALCGEDVVGKGDAGRAMEYGVFPCGLRVQGIQNPEHLELSFREKFSAISGPCRGAGKPTTETDSSAGRIDR